MAANWIKWTKGLASRREVAVIASRLNRDRHEIAGRLMVLWEWCDDNFRDADVLDLSLDVSLILGDTSETALAFLDQITGLPGLAAAMASPAVGWITAGADGEVVFPNLARNNGSTAKTRASSAEKKQRQRKVSPKASPENRDNCPDKTGTKSGPDKIREEKRREEKNKQEAAPPPDGPITETEIAETPTDGPSPVTMLDGGKFVIEWNALAADHPCLVPHGATMLGRFEFEHFRDRIGAGTWSASWQAFQDAVRRGHVTSKGVTLKKLLDGAVLDVVVADQQRRKSSMKAAPAKKKRAAPELPAATKDRPFRELDRATVEEKIADFARAATEAEAKGEIEQATKYAKRSGELDAEREWRDANVQARRRECLEAGGIVVQAGKEIPTIGRSFE